MARTPPWEVSDALWERVQPLMPPTPSHAKGGRPRLPDRAVFAAIVFILRTGIQWTALPRELGASSTVHARFQEWTAAGVFAALWAAELTEFDELVGIDWTWQALDGVMTKAPFGSAASGPNPTDRAKQGVKRSLLTDGAGIPLAVAIDGANRHDMKLVAATLDGLVVARPDPDAEAPQHRCLDAGDAYDASRAEATDRGYDPHIRGRSEERAQDGESGVACPALGGGAHPRLAQPLASAARALGEEGRALSCLRPTRLRPAHFLQIPGFGISS